MHTAHSWGPAQNSLWQEGTVHMLFKWGGTTRMWKWVQWSETTWQGKVSSLQQ
jgi:hypothetical protein